MGLTCAFSEFGGAGHKADIRLFDGAAPVKQGPSRFPEMQKLYDSDIREAAPLGRGLHKRQVW